MIRPLFDWLDARTDYRRVLSPIRRRILPNGASWWFTSASVLLWLFVVEMITGLLLMTTYSPSTTTAWASAHYVELSLAGRVIRGIHYFTSHALLILFAVHVVRVLFTAAFRAPRELVWITGLFLIPLMIVWGVTGNPLSASQKGMTQIEVEAKILGSTPIVGPLLSRMLLGGDQPGHLTLTHLYFLHVGLLPLLVTALLGVHVWQVYRHGVHSDKLPREGRSVPYWPHQTVRNMTVLSVVLGTIVWLSWRQGAPLDAPADATIPLAPRPEWYFRCLFELRAYFTGDWEFVATMVLPAAVLGFFLAVPALDRYLKPRGSLIFRVAVVVLGLVSWSWLTWTSFAKDWNDPEYLAAAEHAEQLAERARLLADREQIPPEGAVTLLRNDPHTQGPLLFARHCASCHPHQDAAGRGIAAAQPSAPNLYGFGTPEWIEGMLLPERITSDQVFGKTRFSAGDMVSKVQEMFDGLEGEALAQRRQAVAAVALALAVDAGTVAAAADNAAQVRQGRALLTGELACTDCHKYGAEGSLGSAPDLTGYASREWLQGLLGNPAHERFYADNNDRMPAFAPHPTRPEQNLLSPKELDLLIAWLRGEWYEPGLAPPARSPPVVPRPERLAEK